MLPHGFAAAVHVYFPDPWPKSRHHKRRLFDPETVDLVLGAARARAGGSCSPPTSWSTARWSAEILPAYPGLRVARRDRPWDEGPRTNYEAKYVVEGRPILRLEVTGRGEAAALRPRVARGCWWLSRRRRRRGEGPMRTCCPRVQRLAYLWPYLRPYRRELISGTAAILASVVVGLARPLLVGEAIDRSAREVARETLLGYAALLVAVALVQGVFSYLQRMILVGMSRDVEFDLRNRVLRQLWSAAARLLPRAPDRRPDGPRHQRPAGGAHALRPGDHVRHQHPVHRGRRAVLHGRASTPA